jgi:carbonic anhydrase
MSTDFTGRTHVGAGCACCGALLLKGGFGRRQFLKLAGGAGFLAAAFPFAALGAKRDYQAMLLSCIDPRFPELTLDYMKGRGMLGQYSQFTIAGAAIGVVAPAFADWSKAFWDNLAASIELHRIKKVIALDHRDCGAARIAYGAESVSTRQREAETHRAALLQFRAEVNKRQPELAVEGGLMGLGGDVEMFSA